MSTLAETREAIYDTVRDEVPHTRVDDDGDLHFRSGPAHVWVIVRAPWDDERHIVDIHAVCNTEVPAGQELTAWVADKANAYIFGQVSYRLDHNSDEVGRVSMNHRLLATGVSDDALITAVRAVSVSGRRVSRDVHDRFGGDTWHPFPEGE